VIDADGKPSRREKRATNDVDRTWLRLIALMDDSAKASSMVITWRVPEGRPPQAFRGS